jgi:23S rRNA (adenine2503-C2)-methyltransferase
MEANMEPQSKTNLLELSLSELDERLSSIHQPPFRARQIWHWLYQELVGEIGSMTNLPKPLRQQLDLEFEVGLPKLLKSSANLDRLTEKALLELSDGNNIETVLLRYPHIAHPRRTVCVSSQVGCAMGCVFCATGNAGYVRNLSAGEIAGQILFFARALQAVNGPGSRVTNLVFMGQGEPLANLDAVWKAIQFFNSPYGYNLAARHITISTVGLVPGILKLAKLPIQVGLAVSLHAPDDTLRRQLIPLADTFPLNELLAACRSYSSQTSRRVTFEYALISGINDDLHLAVELSQLLRGMLCHVNLIPFNPVTNLAYKPSSQRQVRLFEDVLRRHNIVVTVREERGGRIDAACGQLRVRAASDDWYDEEPATVPNSGETQRFPPVLQLPPGGAENRFDRRPPNIARSNQPDRSPVARPIQSETVGGTVASGGDIRQPPRRRPLVGQQAPRQYTQAAALNGPHRPLPPKPDRSYPVQKGHPASTPAGQAPPFPSPPRRPSTYRGRLENTIGTGRVNRRPLSGGRLPDRPKAPRPPEDRNRGPA